MVAWLPKRLSSINFPVKSWDISYNIQYMEQNISYDNGLEAIITTINGTVISYNEVCPC
jgi:hypothetical protein